MDRSVIMKEDEEKMIFSEIEAKMSKKIEKIKKLYQATVDGGDSEIFHKKCDNIPNTLVLIKSQGLRRLGGFTSIPWKSEKKNSFVNDLERKTFVFSLDKKKIYNLKKSDLRAVSHCMQSGPCFGGGRDIAIDNNPIKEKTFYTYPSSFEYNSADNCLSECKNNNKGKLLEYEVFQVIFY